MGMTLLNNDAAKKHRNDVSIIVNSFKAVVIRLIKHIPGNSFNERLNGIRESFWHSDNYAVAQRWRISCSSA